ncbi:MAG TPA: inositol monophosphatase family protein [Acidimicrobiia bacterium]|nr:inositol monophosphatase family protein [Acidimicrobiia bacterium]
MSPTGERAGGSGDLDAHLRAAVDAARAGGEIITTSFGDPANVRSKAPGDWVSDTDTASERAVRAVLERAAPQIPVFGEEEGGERAALGWIVDPLDGTSNFLHRFPVVGVSIALVADGRPVVGVVHAPLLDTTFTAVAGGGTYRDGQRISVSDREPESAICATGFPFRHPKLRPRYLPVLHAALECFEDLRRAGAASLDLAWTAAGVFDGYFELALGPWDVAAGALLVREAGGIVTDWAGDDRAWLDSGNIVVGNPAVHARILDLVGATEG